MLASVRRLLLTRAPRFSRSPARALTTAESRSTSQTSFLNESESALPLQSVAVLLPQLCVNSASKSEPSSLVTVPLPSAWDVSTFGSLTDVGVHPSLLGRLSARLQVAGAAPVQAAAFGRILSAVTPRNGNGPGSAGASAHDVVLHSETGTGKTLAYLLPLLTAILRGAPSAAALARARTRVLVIVPTRELAVQVHGVVEELCRPGKRRAAAAAAAASAALGPTVGAAAVAGGLRYARFVGEVSASALAAAGGGGTGAPHIVVGTPETLRRLVPAHINGGELQAIVLDEADELVRGHSLRAVSAIADWARHARHRPALIAVSATPSPALTEFLRAYARPGTLARVNLLAPSLGARGVGSAHLPRGGMAAAAAGLGRALALPPTLSHELLLVDDASAAYGVLARWLKEAAPRAVLVFHNSAESLEAARLSLSAAGVSVRVLGAAAEGADRNRALVDVASGAAQVLLCTEMGARGLDVPALTHVVNFDAPRSAREYVHRAGRVGRLRSAGAGRGTVISLAAGADEHSRMTAMLGDELGLAWTPSRSS